MTPALLPLSACLWFTMLQVGQPPESFFDIVQERDKASARKFYAKYIDARGLPVVASAEVADETLRRTQEIVNHMLAGRDDVLKAMIADKMYLVIIGKDQVYTDMPEYRNTRDPDYMNERVRGTGGKPTSFGEENVLCLPLDRYDDESIAVHEFCHTIDGTLRDLDPAWTERRNAIYEAALAKGLWKGSYAASNPGEYWAEMCQSYFDCNRVNNWNHGPIGTREQLKQYDPEGYELVRTTFKLTPQTDWRYSYVRTQPSVIAPPAKLKIDPFYTKFTSAREFTVLGRGASDEALLKANDTIRKLFAYRHDILKALIADGVRLVVLGKGETLADLPELADKQEIDLLARVLKYDPKTKLLVVPEENVLANPSDPFVGPNEVIRVMADALYAVTAHRPVDPNWDKRGQAVQQYELGVQRLDIRFDAQLQSCFEASRTNGQWKGTAACHSRMSYWTVGVLAYFDATGQDPAPNGVGQPVTTREALKEYDPALYELVHKTFAYDGRVQWRLPNGK